MTTVVLPLYAFFRLISSFCFNSFSAFCSSRDKFSVGFVICIFELVFVYFELVDSSLTNVERVNVSIVSIEHVFKTHASCENLEIVE